MTVHLIPLITLTLKPTTDHTKKNEAAHSASFLVQRNAVCDADRKKRQVYASSGLTKLYVCMIIRNKFTHEVAGRTEARQRIRDYRTHQCREDENDREQDLLLGRERVNYGIYAGRSAV